jgi:hypothetical protein
MQYIRACFVLDVGRAEAQTGTREFTAATKKWRAWIDSHTQEDSRMFQERQHEMQTEFQRSNPKQWETIDDLPPDLQFTPIWPRGPSFTEEGAAIIRFLTAADCPNVSIRITNRETK